MISIIDYGAGNIGSVVNMIEYLGEEARLVREPSEVLESEKIILPGVGSFDSGMTKLQQSGVIPALNHVVLERKVPFLGICLGAQLCTLGSEEGDLPGLGWFNARTVRFAFTERRIKIPHMGWNYVKLEKSHPLFDEMHPEPRFYFVHKYYMQSYDQSDVLCSANYGHSFAAGLHRNNIIAVQFHPEKSHKYGMRLLENFISL